jgi:sugar/nucleoside kinase (ribokinase family)
MSVFFVSGSINIETTARIDGFPIAYTPVRYPFFGIQSAVAGAGYNIARSLHTLGDTVRFASMIGQDTGGTIIDAQLNAEGIDPAYVVRALDETLASVVLYDPDGKRMINADLKDIQTRSYPPALFKSAVQDVDVAVLGNVNFSRAFLAHAKTLDVPIATDVHAVRDLESDYDGAFMAAADILFMSDENLPVAPEVWTRQVWDRYAPAITVIGMGAQGALLGIREADRIALIPAVTTRPIVNTIGAGDALFSSFLHTFAATHDPELALRKAVVFASWKIGAAGAADGFLSAPELDELYAQVSGNTRPAAS